MTYVMYGVDLYSHLDPPQKGPVSNCLPTIKRIGVLKFLMGNAMTYGDLIPFKAGFDKCIQLNHPDPIKYVLLTNPKNYRKADNHIRFREVLGDGLLASQGEKWKRDRQMLQPAFRKELLETIYAQTVINVTQEIKEKWFSAAKNKEAVNVTQDMAYITLKVILQTMFGDNASPDDVKKIDHVIQAFMLYVGLPRIIPAIDLNKFFNRKKYNHLQALRNDLKKYIKNIYDKEITTPSSYPNMMRLMINARSEMGDQFTFEDIYDQSITMFFAGYETTATLLQWAWLCLDQNPHDIDKIISELSSVDLNNLKFESVDSLPYLDAVLKETMRLYPSFWTTTRAPLEDDVIGGHLVKKGTTLLLPQYVMHRHPKFWNNPESFIPERFMDGNEKNIPAGVYFPFSLGHRKCIGYRFAEMEAKIVLAMLLPIFRLTCVPNQNMAIKPIISLRLMHDLMMTPTEH